MSISASQKFSNVFVYIFLTILAIGWLIPFLWILMTSFRGEPGGLTSYIIPHQWTLNNYNHVLFGTDVYDFRRWFMNTLGSAICVCIFSTFFTISTAYAFSRHRFNARKNLMTSILILQFFPSFLSLIIIYYILKAFGAVGSLPGYTIVMFAGGALSFAIAKGFFDTIPKSLDEAAKLDGATNSQVFSKIILPLSKPMIVSISLTAFMIPWMDFVACNILLGQNPKNFTVGLGMYFMVNRENMPVYFTQFAACSIIIAVPIVLLFLYLQRYYVEGITGGSVKG